MPPKLEGLCRSSAPSCGVLLRASVAIVGVPPLERVDEAVEREAREAAPREAVVDRMPVDVVRARGGVVAPGPVLGPRLLVVGHRRSHLGGVSSADAAARPQLWAEVVRLRECRPEMRGGGAAMSGKDGQMRKVWSGFSPAAMLRTRSTRT